MKSYTLRLIIILFITGLHPAIILAKAFTEASTISSRAASYLNKLKASPLLFTENRGQVIDDKGNQRQDVLFTANSCGAIIFLTANSIRYQFTKIDYPTGYEQNEKMVNDHSVQEKLRQQIKTSTHRFILSLEDANPNPIVTEEEQNSYVENFYLSQCPQGIMGVHTCSRIIYEGVYSGIDWVIYSNQAGLKYDFIVHPGADPSQIKLRVVDADTVTITKEGELVMATSLGEVREKAPVSFCSGQKIATRFEKSHDIIHYLIGAYDKRETLIIDPSVSWATYYGGNRYDVAEGCAVDVNGNVFITGHTLSNTLSVSGFQNAASYQGDAFIAKFNSSGVLLWASYYGDSLADLALSCAADSVGNVYMAGYTYSRSGIAWNGFQTTYGGNVDAFLVKFNSGGARIWSTYYGGDGTEYGASVIVNGRDVYLAGSTTSSSGISTEDVPVAHGGRDAYLVRFDSSGTRIWGRYFGGSDDEWGTACAVDKLGNVYLAGRTVSSSGVALGGFQNSFGGGLWDAFLVQYDTSGVQKWSTYYGGSELDVATSCTVDPNDDVYLAGSTASSSGIASGGFQNYFAPNNIGCYDAYLAKFNAAGARLWATYYGGNGHEDGNSCIVDANANVYLVGTSYTNSGLAFGGFQDSLRGDQYDAFIAEFNSTGAREWASYFGGSTTGTASAIDAAGSIFITGFTRDSTRLVTAGALQPTAKKDGDAYLAKISGFTTTIVFGVETKNWPGTLTTYPNPADNILTVEADYVNNQGGQLTTISLTDALGRQVYTTTLKAAARHLKTTIQIPAVIANGLYYLKISTPTMQAAKIVMIQH